MDTIPIQRVWTAGEVTLRLACEDDRERVWEWNFAPDVRARSVSTRVVTFADHARWFSRRIAEGTMWIIEENRVGVGVLRLDRVDGDTKISIALTQRVRGRGIGKRAIAAACELWGQPIIAEILPDNAASRACFAACGFRHVGTVGGLVIYRWNP
jgi:RimJ/RimL family protein N-acetyltransferase